MYEMRDFTNQTLKNMAFKFLLGLVFLCCYQSAYSGDISPFLNIEGKEIFLNVPMTVNGHSMEQFTIGVESETTHENYPFFSPVPLEVVFSIDEGVHRLFHVSIAYCNYDGDTSDCVSLGEDIHKLVNQHKLQKLVMRKK